MASLMRIWSLSLACGGLLLCSHAMAQIAPGAGSNAPIDIEADKAEQYQDMHMYVWTGAVEVVQSGARLVSDKLTAYTYGPNEGPNAQGAAPAPTAKPASNTDQGLLSSGSIKQMVAEGHVFYVTQDQTVKGDHMVYDAEPDTITITGNVVAAQGKNVARGDKMLIDRKTGHTTMVSDATGRNKPNRVRAVIYSQSSQNGQGQTAASGAQAPAKRAAAPAKKP